MTSTHPLCLFLHRYLREPANSLTHAVGIVLSVVGLIALLSLSAGDPWRVAAFGIYGVSLVLLYTASTLLHALKVGERAQRYLRKLDHAAIFVLIAGSYTPVTLVTLRDEATTLAWTLFGIVWGIAVLGVVFKLVWIEAPRWLSVGLYMLMGWLAVLALGPLWQAMPAGGLLWLALGGAFYSVGAIVYATKRPDFLPGVLGYHELWHLFVLAGSACHFLMMLLYVLPE